MALRSIHTAILRSIHSLIERTFAPVILLSGLLLMMSCGTGKGVQPSVAAAPPPPAAPAPPAARTPGSPAPSKPETPAFSAAADLQEIMDFLASDALKGRDTGSEGLEEAADFLVDRLKAYGIRPYFEAYRDTLGNTKETAYNIVGCIPGSDPDVSSEIVLVGAHYDHIGIVPLKNGDGIANGANDNASGTATVLELARYFSTAPAPRRSLVFAFFSAEERGLLGSKHLAEKLKGAGAKVYTVLNYEMTGVPMQAKDYMVYLTGFHKSNLAEVSNSYGGDDLVGYLPQAADYNLFQRSDNYPFFEAYKVPSHTFSTFDFTNYAYYHQPGDEAEKMDFTHMAALVNRMIPVVHGIADAPSDEIRLR